MTDSAPVLARSHSGLDLILYHNVPVPELIPGKSATGYGTILKKHFIDYFKWNFSTLELPVVFKVKISSFKIRCIKN
jgi:hypothetical protein